MDSIRDRRDIVEKTVDNLGSLYIFFRHYPVETSDFGAQKPNINYRLKEIRAMEMRLKGIFTGQRVRESFRTLDLVLDWAEKLVMNGHSSNETNAACAEKLWGCRDEVKKLMEDEKQKKLEGCWNEPESHLRNGIIMADGHFIDDQDEYDEGVAQLDGQWYNGRGA